MLVARRDVVRSVALCSVLGFVALYAWNSSAEDSMAIIDESPSSKLLEMVGNIFVNSNHITIKYIRNLNLGTPFPTRENFEERWTDLVSYRCPINCENRATKIYQYLSAGLRLDGKCPDPYFARIEFSSFETSVESISIQQSGQCFVLSGSSYFVQDSFHEILSEEPRYPDVAE